jgi:hypothetical protein
VHSGGRAAFLWSGVLGGGVKKGVLYCNWYFDPASSTCDVCAPSGRNEDHVKALIVLRYRIVRVMIGVVLLSIKKH